MILGLANMLNMIYRVASVSSIYLRYSGLKNVAISTPKSVLRVLVNKCGYGDWFILMLMAKNIEAPLFSEAIDEIYIALQERSSEYMK